MKKFFKILTMCFVICLTVITLVGCGNGKTIDLNSVISQIDLSSDQTINYYTLSKLDEIAGDNKKEGLINIYQNANNTGNYNSLKAITYADNSKNPNNVLVLVVHIDQRTQSYFLGTNAHFGEAVVLYKGIFTKDDVLNSKNEVDFAKVQTKVTTGDGALTYNTVESVKNKVNSL